MRRILVCAAVGLALLAIGWRLERTPHPIRAHFEAPSTSVVDLPRALPATQAAEPAAPLPSLTSPGLVGAASPEGLRWSAPDGRWSVTWGWAVIEGLPSRYVEVREEGGRWVADHGAIQEVFEPRTNGIEHILQVSVRPPKLEVRIPVDASVRSWDFDGQPRVTLSRPQQGDLLEVQGLTVCDAEGRRLAASLSHQPGTVLITVEDDDAVYPVTIDPLITPPSWVSDPVDVAGAAFGTSVAGVGDFNRDGFADILVGTRSNPAAPQLPGAHLFLGSAQGPLSTASWVADTPVGSVSFGSRVAGAGDVNGDLFADVVVGDPGYVGAGGTNGRAFLYLGGATGPASAAAWTAQGTGNSYFGNALAAAGDINGDGRGDLLVGADGTVFLYYGTATGLAASPAWSASQLAQSFGESVASAGDVNGDGFRDVVIGAPACQTSSGTGRAYLYAGTSSGLSTTPAWIEDQDGGAFGSCVAGAGDINQDGYDDVLVGAQSAGLGKAYLYLGSASGLAATPVWTADTPDPGHRSGFGRVVASPGDLNGDGRRDVVVSLPDTTGDPFPQGGAAFVYLGTSSGLQSYPSIHLAPTGQPWSTFGSALAGAGDTNGDARADLVVGAPAWTNDTYNWEGRAYVYFGASTRTAVPWLVSPANAARLGTATATLDWADCADANGIQSYDVEVDDASTFDLPLRWSATVAASQATTGALPDGYSYWRVRARDAQGNLSDWSLVRSVNLDGSAPTVPMLVAPLANTVISPTPTLRWSASTDNSGIAGYDAQVSATSDFSATQWSGSTTGQLTVTTSALGAGTHWWRARARDPWGYLSAWSAGASFIVDAVPPSAPSLLAPANGSTINVGNPVLDWTDASGATDYYVVVDNEPTLAAPNSWTGSAASSQVETGYLSGNQFYWAVAALDTAGNSAWSMIGSFTRSTSLPGGISAVSPTGWAAFTNPVVALDWTDASDPDGVQGYDVQVSTDSTWTASPVWTGAPSGSSSTTSALPEAVLYWRVRAVDTLGNRGSWYQFGSFQVDQTPPTAPSLVSPAEGALVFDSTLRLDWTDVTDNLGSPSYEVEVDTEPTFSAPLAAVAFPGPSWTDTEALADGLYYWRVRARDGAGNRSAYSAVRTFTMDGAPPAAPTLLSPASGATVVSSTPTLDWADVVDSNGVTYEVQVDDTDQLWPPPLVSATGLATSQWTAPWVGDSVLRYWRVRAVDGLGAVSPWSATRSFVVDRGRGFYVGLGAGAAGLLGACRDEAAGFAWRPVYTLVDATYNAASGETRPAAGDLDGDGVCELVVGRGRTSSSGGWFAIVDDQATGFTVLRWIQLPFSAYNAANGETWPACGDIDGDGRDEIIVGLGTYTSLGGYFALYDDASTGYAFIGWRRISWSQYNAANGETRPAVGDLTGDGKAEVFVGLGRYPARGGRVARYTSGSVAFSAWMQFGYTAYNAANGETWPACGNIDDDARDELCVGMGAYPQGGGYFQYFNDSLAKYASLGLKRLPWTEYNNAVGETRPSIGPLAGGAGDETVIGLGAWPAARGYVAVMQRAPGYALQAWKRVPVDPFNATNGATRPAVRR